MKTLHVLHEDLYTGVPLRIDRFGQACKKLDIQLNVINGKNVNYTKLPKLGKNDLLYKLSDFGSELETHLLNSNVTTFYKQNPLIANNIFSTDFSLIHNKSAIPQPKTISHNTCVDREILAEYVDYVNGFPLIIKTYGQSRGIGVIKIDSWQSFISTVDFLVGSKIKFLIREYIKCNAVSRFIVLGNNVIASWFTEIMDADFRNVADISLSHLYKTKIPKVYPKILNDIAVHAVEFIGIEFGAVDVVFDKEDNPYVLEVNFPCGLTFDPSGENEIVEKMVSYLIEKSKI